MGSLDVPTSGEVTIAGRKISRMDDDDLTLLRRDHIGFVFQQFNLIPLLSVVENVEYPLILKGRQNGARKRAEEVLTAVGIAATPLQPLNRVNSLEGSSSARRSSRALVQRP
jgi:ABC-type antimicrobial peptide transport system, ATPase component